MSNHNPKRLLVAGLSAVVIGAGVFLSPTGASADGPRPHAPGVFIGGGAQTGAIINGMWVPQGSPLLGTTYGGDGQVGWVVEDFGEFPARVQKAPVSPR